jgi:hypothetical protein
MGAARGILQTDKLFGGGVALATIGGVLMDVGSTQADSSHQDAWSSPWFDGGCMLVTCGVVLVAFALIASWRRTPTPSPLLLRIVKEDWRLFSSAVWVLGLAVSATNFTNESIILTNYYLQCGPNMAERSPITQAVWDRANTLKIALSSDHAAELFAGEITVPPAGSITRWHVDTVYVPLPHGGRPHCTFQVKDTLGNTYELDIPARLPKTYRS